MGITCNSTQREVVYRNSAKDDRLLNRLLYAAIRLADGPVHSLVTFAVPDPADFKVAATELYGADHRCVSLPPDDLAQAFLAANEAVHTACQRTARLFDCQAHIDYNQWLDQCTNQPASSTTVGLNSTLCLNGALAVYKGSSLAKEAPAAEHNSR